MKKLLSFLLLTTFALGANVQVRDLSITTVLPAANDYHLVDGSTNGTSKSLALNITRQVATRVALAALSVTNAGDQNTVWVLGATAAGDGGAAMYYYVSTSTATPDGNKSPPGDRSSRFRTMHRVLLSVSRADTAMPL